jgi:hypothetical protein
MKKFVALPLVLLVAAACSENTPTAPNAASSPTVRATAVAGGHQYTFEGSDISGAGVFSPYTIATAPNGQNFLGIFGRGQTVTVDLGTATHVTVTVDLYAIGSWFGTHQTGYIGPDSWEIGYACGSPTATVNNIFTTSVSNLGNKRQNYPNQITDPGYFGSFNGAAALGTLGYTFAGQKKSDVGDSIYRMTKSANISCGGGQAYLVLLAPASGNLDRQWGVDNLTVVTS